MGHLAKGRPWPDAIDAGNGAAVPRRQSVQPDRERAGWCRLSQRAAHSIQQQRRARARGVQRRSRELSTSTAPERPAVSRDTKLCVKNQPDGRRAVASAPSQPPGSIAQSKSSTDAASSDTQTVDRRSICRSTSFAEFYRGCRSSPTGGDYRHGWLDGIGDFQHLLAEFSPVKIRRNVSGCSRTPPARRRNAFSCPAPSHPSSSRRASSKRGEVHHQKPFHPDPPRRPSGTGWRDRACGCASL